MLCCGVRVAALVRLWLRDVGVRGLLPLVDLPHRSFCLVDQDWLVPVPAKIVVTAAGGGVKGGRGGMREPLQGGRPCLTKLDEDKETRDRPITNHTKHHPQSDPRSTIGGPRRAQRPQGPQAAKYVGCIQNATESLIRPQGMLDALL